MPTVIGLLVQSTESCGGGRKTHEKGARQGGKHAWYARGLKGRLIACGSKRLSTKLWGMVIYIIMYIRTKRSVVGRGTEKNKHDNM